MARKGACLKVMCLCTCSIVSAYFDRVFTRPVGSGANNLLKFVDFVNEKDVKAKVVGMKIQTRISLRMLPESIKTQYLLMSYKSKLSNFSLKILISRDPLLPSVVRFPKAGRYPTI